MFDSLLYRSYYGNTVIQYLTALAVLLIGFLLVRVLKVVIVRQLHRFSQKTATSFDDFMVHAIEKRMVPLFYLAVAYISVQGLTLHDSVEKGIRVLFAILLTIMTTRLVISIISYATEKYWAKREMDESKRGAFRGILAGVQVIIWGIAIIVLLDNLGIEISTLVAGLGIGGVAIALASQAVLGDLFSYITIFFDRPFEIGDFIIVGEFLGTVEHVGIKTTRVRSLGGEQLVFCNTDLTSSRIRNYKRMEKRRIVFTLGVTYDTTLEHTKEIPTILREIVDSVSDTTFDRAHFKSYGDFNLIYEVVYYVLTSDYNKYMDIQQAINFRVKEEFEKRGIEFAFPTQTLYVNTEMK